MKRRLYFVLPDVGSARKLQDDLLLAHVTDRQMRFLAKRGTDLGDLHEAGRLQKTDQLPAAQLGMIIVGVLGAAIGWGIHEFQPFDLQVNKVVILGMMLFGAVFGFWAGNMVGAALPNSRLRRFTQDIEAGRVLLMLDVPRQRMEEFSDIVKRKHPEADARGFDPTVPAFP